MTILTKLVLSLAIASLYVGFAGAMGALIRRVRSKGSSRADLALTVGYTAIVYLPASVLVLNSSGWSMVARSGLLAVGVFVAYLTALQPRWAPDRLWDTTFARRYFAFTMALAAFWEIGVALSAATLTPALIGAAAGAAGIASLYSTPRRT